MARLAVRVNIDHGCFDVRMTQYFFQRKDVGSFIGQPGGEGVTEIVKTEVLDPSLIYRCTKAFLYVRKLFTSLRAWKDILALLCYQLREESFNNSFQKPSSRVCNTKLTKRAGELGRFLW